MIRAIFEVEDNFPYPREYEHEHIFTLDMFGSHVRRFPSPFEFRVTVLGVTGCVNTVMIPCLGYRIILSVLNNLKITVVRSVECVHSSFTGLSTPTRSV
jgi:hypothetical protein